MTRMGMKITRPQGTEDVTPKQIYKWHTVERMVRETAESFGFHETRIPTFESTDLFLRSVGETTDVVQKEMYTVKAKETEFTLRPEGTSGTIRSMLQNGMLNDALPQKVYYPASVMNVPRQDGSGNFISSALKWQGAPALCLTQKSFPWPRQFWIGPA